MVPIWGTAPSGFGREVWWSQIGDRTRGAERRARAEWFNAWQSHRSVIEEVHTRGDRVLLLTRDHFVASDGLETDWSLSSLRDVKDGKIVRMQIFGEDRKAAWKAFEAPAA